VEDICITVEKAIDYGIFMAAFNHLLPFPGTPTYDRLKAENRLVYDKWWLSPDFRFGEVPFYPKSMSRNGCMKNVCEPVNVSTASHQSYVEELKIFREIVVL
jgi:radical SAM superfamily enzyme YgiQ (UPF0313 family)